MLTDTCPQCGIKGIPKSIYWLYHLIRCGREDLPFGSTTKRIMHTLKLEGVIK